MKRLQLTADQRRWILVGLVIAAVVICIAQLLYPRDRLAPFTTIDTVKLGGWQQKDATWVLNNRLASQPVELAIKETDQTYKTAKPAAFGLTIENRVRVEMESYPLWARLLPTSLLWYHWLTPQGDPQYQRSSAKLDAFMKDELGDCRLSPTNAGIAFTNGQLKVLPAKPGGKCNESEVRSALNNVKPTLGQPTKVMINATVIKPKIGDEAAEKLIQELEANSKNGVTIKVSDNQKTIPQSDLLSWLTLTPKGDELVVGIDEKKSNQYFDKHITPQVTVPAGVTKVTTRDFTELSRQTGKTGRTLNTDATHESLLAVLSGEPDEAEAITKPVKPTVLYTRSYTKTSTGIAALLQHYNQDNEGVFGVSFVELEGRGLSAAHSQDKIFTTASTYKLFVAFSTLKKVDSGKYKWTDDIVGGRDLETCFEDMIVKSDNPCAEALLEKIGREQLDDDLRSIGLARSTFRAKSNQTTAAELAIFLTKLEENDLPLKSSSRTKLLSAMKRQQYRQGIPAGTSGTVADKVGFLNGLLHDAGIVYSPKGTYVLVILSDGSTWANIADLTKKIEALR